ncbi:MAG: TIGR00282 family metallophosphoesterase [Candidatus Parcubacteria bacterium]|nr:TIGR00282 family metallophosphoesterase [Candidatus Parcubacteria bacterium]
MTPIKILFLGDIFGKIGRQGTKKILPEFKVNYQPDFIFANAENLAHGRGVTESTLNELKELGIDLFTSGNHVFDKEGARKILDQKNPILIRPANYLGDVPGTGEKIVKVGRKSLLVLNLIGRVFFKEDFACPFQVADRILQKYAQEKLNGIFVDFHAEATSEKKALGFYLDGKVSAILGTHTHVQTSDEIILEKGTAFITDVGMTGPKDSVIGLEKETIINNFIYGSTKSADVPEKGICQINCVYLEINPTNQQAVKIERINTEVEV